MRSDATTVKKYLASLPADRRSAIEAVRQVVLKNLPKGYEEGMQYGMIGYYVPHSLYPPGYHCNPKEPLPYINLASQKNYMSLYMTCLYSDSKDEKWFREEWAKTGKKLNMGKCCVRFRRIDDLPLPLIGKAVKLATVKKFVAHYESVIKRPKKKPSTKKTAAKKNPAKKTTKKKAAPKKVAKKKTVTKKKTATRRKKKTS